KLDHESLREGVLAYAKNLGLRVRSIVRQESGVLPLPGTASASPVTRDGVMAGGYQGGFYHPTTGYSFPLAVRVAEAVARAPVAELRHQLQLLARVESRQQRYVALLNRLLFGAFAPEERVFVLERFYRLPAPTIRRFYALTLTPHDRAR